MPSVYVETSIISYLAARPSRDLIVAARQQITHTWWRSRRPMFDLYVSQVVLDEILAGDRAAADRRAALVAELPLLDIVPEVADLAGAPIQWVPLPTTAGADAAHIATAAYHRIEFLMTWNSTHIANAAPTSRRANLPGGRVSRARPVHAG